MHWTTLGWAALMLAACYISARSGFQFTEGPASDAEGNVYFTAQPNDRILKWSVNGKLSTFMQSCGRCTGFAGA